MATAQLELQRLLIGGEWTEASSGAEFERTDPFTGEPAGTAAAAKREDARAAADAAGEAFPAWAVSPPSQRRELLQKAAAQTTAMRGEVIPSDVPGLTAMGVRQPAGVVVGIAPWNAPIILGTRAVASPLAYGHTVVLNGSA